MFALELSDKAAKPSHTAFSNLRFHLASATHAPFATAKGNGIKFTGRGEKQNGTTSRQFTPATRALMIFHNPRGLELAKPKEKGRPN